ncbi:MAG TPA: hypothetical protein VLO11_14125, partial [Luteolibacter sp.]|nr:hypothetical protein [Luteolibacter sp.]
MIHFTRPAISRVRLLADCIFTAMLPLAAFSAESRTRNNFAAGWWFAKGNPTGAEQADFDHSAWRQL